MTKRPPKPPKRWAARGLDHDPNPRISGTGPNGELILHPDEFARLVKLGVIDQHGRRIGGVS